MDTRLFFVFISITILRYTSINQSMTVIKYNVGLSILFFKRMTLDDSIEPESKFVSVQRCQRPLVSFCDAKVILFCESYVRNI